MPFLGFRLNRDPVKNKVWQIPETDAFEYLIALALKQERPPQAQDILIKGKAEGFSERMRILADSFGWEFTYTIKDKKP